jgi:hypothetical protein
MRGGWEAAQRRTDGRPKGAVPTGPGDSPSHGGKGGRTKRAQDTHTGQDRSATALAKLANGLCAASVVRGVAQGRGQRQWERQSRLRAVWERLAGDGLTVHVGPARGCAGLRAAGWRRWKPAWAGGPWAHGLMGRAGQGAGGVMPAGLFGPSTEMGRAVGIALQGTRSGGCWPGGGPGSAINIRVHSIPGEGQGKSTYRHCQ